MKLFFLFSLACCIALNIFAQPQEFEGKLIYRASVLSKTPLISARTFQQLLLEGDTTAVYIRQGNIARLSTVGEEYYIPKDKKVYIHFKGVDTLFYRSYLDDTSALKTVKDMAGEAEVAGYPCRSIELVTASDTSLYRYAPQLYANPEHTKELMLSHLNILGEKTKSLWLLCEARTSSFVFTQTCYGVVPMKVENSLFVLPKLPLAKFQFDAIFQKPKYMGNGTWDAYLRKNMNLDLVVNNIPIKKGQRKTQQTAQVTFVVLENGEITQVQVVNAEAVSPALVSEAIRLVQESKWAPALLLGKTISYPLRQPIVFQVVVQ